MSLKLVTLSAFNLDVVFQAENDDGLQWFLEQLWGPEAASPPAGREVSACGDDEAVVRKVLQGIRNDEQSRRHGALQPPFAGGAGYLTFRTVAQLLANTPAGPEGLRLCGLVGDDGWEVFDRDIRRIGLDLASQPPVTLVRCDGPAGISLGTTGGARPSRTIRTAPGVNEGIISAYLGKPEAGQALLEAISSTRFLHVSSFLCPAGIEAAGQIGDLIGQARQYNPALHVSVDPGPSWVYQRSAEPEPVSRLFAQSDLVYLSARDFRAACNGDPHAMLARLRHTGNECLLTFEALRDELRVDMFLPTGEPATWEHRHEGNVVDFRGAGAVMLGGYLASLIAYQHSSARAGLHFAARHAALTGNLPRLTEEAAEWFGRP